jgi:FkbH-like protein
MTDVTAPAPDLSTLDRVDWQATLFSSRLSRLALMRLAAPAPAAPALRVFRNHAFERAAPILRPFLAYADIPLDLELGDYDDSLSAPADSPAAALVWLDFARYPRLDDSALVQWVTARLDALRSRVSGLIVVANAPDGGPRMEGVNRGLAAWASATPGAAVLALDRIAEGLGPSAFDAARAAVTGTRYADPLCLEAARTLAFDVLAPSLARPIKALAVDLDNTLYQGVLGEDGPEGVALTEGHAALQREVAALAARGVLVSVVSRNEPDDVADLFARRPDFPLRPEMVASWHVSWGEKADAVAAAASRFNIGADAVLLIDDNVGELARVAGRHPGLRLLHASGAPAETAAALRRYPGLPADGAAFAGRAADLNANAERAALARTVADEEAYLRDLKAELSFALNPGPDRARLAELSRKTNQFNLALRRLDEVEVARYLAAPDRCAVHVRLSDRLADSGSVAEIFARREGEALVVDELCISCRALGRGLETLMVAEAVRAGLGELGGTKVGFSYVRGPRNAPALDWLAALCEAPVEAEAGRMELPAARFADTPETPVTLRWIDV